MAKQSNIDKKITKWKNILGLINWDITVKFDKNIKNSCKKEIKQGFSVNGSNETQIEYFSSILKFPNKKISEETILHELCHCLTEEMCGYIRSNFAKEGSKDGLWLDYFNERLVTQIERILYRLNKQK
jgi:S-ribosylhomocysteine lyase LuxS involved in autoinducer biosynthesis